MNSRKDRSLRFFLIFALLGGTSLEAQPAKTSASARHTLWKVQGKQNTVYLLGSVHVLKKEDYPLPSPIEAAFADAKIAVFETDIAGMENPELAMKLATRGQLPEGETLQSRLSAPVYSSFSNHIQKAGMPVELFNSFTPAMAALTLVALDLKKMGLDPQKGLDNHFFELADKQGKKTVPLETLDFQINLLTDFTKEEGELLMKTTLKEIDTMDKDLDDLINAWRIGDAGKLDKFLNEAMEEAPVIFKRLLTDRNRNWLPKIEELLNGEDNAIVIVGAGHLVGTNGVVALLKSKGNKIVQE
jgi:uncharacterized protein YbaP (TraB family)